jgi:hypothetical protein
MPGGFARPSGIEAVIKLSGVGLPAAWRRERPGTSVEGSENRSLFGIYSLGSKHPLPFRAIIKPAGSK